MPRTNTDPTGFPLKSTPIAVSGSTQSISLTGESKRVSIAAVGGAVRYELKTAVTLTADAATSHYLGEDQRIDLAVPSGAAKLAVIRATGSAATSVEVTELS
jgi:hypothetical protein